MKNFCIALFFWVLLVSCAAQTPLDSTIVYLYSNTDSVPHVKSVYHHDLFGKLTSNVFYGYDTCQHVYTPLALHHLVYNGEQIIEVLQHIRENDIWVPAYRTVITYPVSGQLRQFYNITGEQEELMWQINYEYDGDDIQDVSVDIPDLINSDLYKLFTETRTYTDGNVEIISSKLKNNEYRPFHRTQYIKSGAKINEKIFERRDQEDWIIIDKMIYHYDSKNRINRQINYYHEAGEYLTEPYRKEYFYYNEIAINPPEIDAQCLIAIYQVNGQLYVKSKLDLASISLYTLDADLIRKETHPKTSNVVWLGIRGEFLVEVITKDNRKKIEKVIFN